MDPEGFAAYIDYRLAMNVKPRFLGGTELGALCRDTVRWVSVAAQGKGGATRELIFCLQAPQSTLLVMAANSSSARLSRRRAR
jgi:hypothetical protein